VSELEFELDTKYINWVHCGYRDFSGAWRRTC
jgi:hypothetical protein